MTNSSWRMIARSGSNESEIKKSRFICEVKRVESDVDAREFIAELKKKHWDASHNCSAYIIGELGQIQRSSDDGEPSGTAGTPMLEVLRKMRLTGTAVVVTRYFGGTLLGAGGLIRAYGNSVSEAITKIGVVQRQELSVVAVSATHVESGKLHNSLAASGFPEAIVTYDATGARFELRLAEVEVEPFMVWVAEATNGASQAVIEGYCNIEVPVDLHAERPN